MGKIEAESVF